MQVTGNLCCAHSKTLKAERDRICVRDSFLGGLLAQHAGSPGCDPYHHTVGLMICICNANTWEVKAGGAMFKIIFSYKETLMLV